MHFGNTWDCAGGGGECPNAEDEDEDDDEEYADEYNVALKLFEIANRLDLASVDFGRFASTWEYVKMFL